MRIELNNEQNGIELYFDEKPSGNIITELKENKWRWHKVKKCWYAKNTEDKLTYAKNITNEDIEVSEGNKLVTSTNIKYGKQISDYITKEEFEERLRKYYSGGHFDRHSDDEINSYVNYALENYYNNESEYYNLSKYIRQAIIWKSIGGEVNKFKSNGDGAKYYAVWDKLPIIQGIEKTDVVYSAMWGYDQTQITTATYYGKAFGLDVLITGGFGSGDVLLKRISKNGTFSDGCIHFSANEFTSEEITETNEYASLYGR